MQASSTDLLSGSVFRDGTTAIGGWEDWLLRDAVGATELPPVHPVFALIAVLRGIGTGLDELLALVGATPADGPLLGSCSLTFHQAIGEGVQYRVEGSVLDIESKVGKRSGPFDVITYELRLLDENGDRVVEVVNGLIVPKGDRA